MDSNLDIYEPLQLAGSPSLPECPPPEEESSCQEIVQPSTEGVDKDEDTTVLFENGKESSVHSEENELFEGFEERENPYESECSNFDYLEELVEEEEYLCDCSQPSMVSKLSLHSYKGGWERFGLDVDPWDDEEQPTCQVLNYEDLELTEDEREGILTDRIVYACSSYLDKNPESQRLTLSKLVAQDKCLCDIQILEVHRYLQYIDLAHNNLRDIWPLSGVPYLMHLDVSHNELTEVLNFKAPWNLTYVDFSFNRVKTIQDLSDFWSLVYLDLSNNRIQKIEGLMNLRYLNYLNLSMNVITCFENLNNLFIGILDISRNLISTFEEGPGVGMHTMVNLSELDISCNSLTTLAIFKDVYYLKACNIEENNISELYEIDHMKTLRELSILNLSGNGLTQWPKYRQMVINTIRSLAVLDQSSVETQERVGASVTFDPNQHIKSACHLAKIQLLEDSGSPPSLGLDVNPFDQGPYPLVLLVGPDGSMKEHLINWIASKFPDKVYKSISYTSRMKTKQEVDGEDYHFVTQEEFNTMARSGTFLYMDELLGDSYGFSRFEIEAAVKQKKLCLAKMEILGALTLKAYGLEPTLVLTIAEDADLHYQRLIGKYRASMIQTSKCSMVSTGAVTMGLREPKSQSRDDMDTAESYVLSIIADSLDFKSSSSSPDAGMTDTVRHYAQGTSTGGVVGQFEGQPSVQSLTANMNCLRSESRPTQSRDLAVDNHYVRPSRDVVGMENAQIRPSRDVGMDIPQGKQSRDVGMDNPQLRQSRDVGIDNTYVRPSRDVIGTDISNPKQSKDNVIDNNLVRQSRDVIGQDSPYVRPSRDVIGQESPYVRPSRDVIGQEGPCVRPSKDMGIDNPYLRPSKDMGIDNPYMRPSRDVVVDNPYMRASRDVGVSQQMGKIEDIYLVNARNSTTSRPNVQFQDGGGYFNPEPSVTGVANDVNSSPTQNTLSRQDSSQSEFSVESGSVSTNRSLPTVITNDESKRSDPAVTDDMRSFSKIKENQSCSPGECEEPPRFASFSHMLTSSEDAYIKSIIKTRETYFHTHRDHPGVFAETVYTDDLHKAHRKFERFVRDTYRSRPSRYPVFNIEEDKSYQSMIAQRLEAFKQEINNEQRTMNKQLDEMSRYRAPRMPPQRSASTLDREMQKRQETSKPILCKLASV